MPWAAERSDATTFVGPRAGSPAGRFHTDAPSSGTWLAFGQPTAPDLPTQPEQQRWQTATLCSPPGWMTVRKAHRGRVPDREGMGDIDVTNGNTNSWTFLSDHGFAQEVAADQRYEPVGEHPVRDGVVRCKVVPGSATTLFGVSRG